MRKLVLTDVLLLPLEESFFRRVQIKINTVKCWSLGMVGVPVICTRTVHNIIF